MAKHDARQGFDFDIPDGFALLDCEVAHLHLSKADVFKIAFGKLAEARLDLLSAQAEILALPVVEFLRQVLDGQVSARFDVGEDGFDLFADPAVGGLEFRSCRAALEVMGHGSVLPPKLYAAGIKWQQRRRK